MKRVYLVLFAVLTLVAFAMAAYAGSAGGNAPAIGKVNVPLTVPKVSRALCQNMAAGKTGTATFSVYSTTMVNWKAFASATDATAVTVKRKLNTNTHYMPASGETNLPIEAHAQNLVFGKFSSATNSVTPVICVDRN